MSNMKYFIYSREQFKERTTVEANLGRKFYAGTLIVRGKPKQFTQMVSNLKEVRYPDYKIIAHADADTVNYTRPYAI